MANKISKINQQMIFKNNRLSGFFMVEDAKGKISLNGIDFIPNGSYISTEEGTLHNESGPAIINSDLKSVSYYIRGKRRAWPEAAIIHYNLVGSLQGNVYHPDPKAKIIGHEYITYSPSMYHHSLSGPAVMSPGEGRGKKSELYYYIRGKLLSKNGWDRDPEVMRYQKKLAAQKTTGIILEDKFENLTQNMLDQNPNLSGTFFVRSKLSWPNKNQKVNKNLIGYVFLKDGVLHNDNGPAFVDIELRVVKFFKKGNLLESPYVGCIDYQYPGQIEGDEFIAPKYGESYHHHFDSKEDIHCLNGPASKTINCSSGLLKSVDYFVHGKELSKEQWESHAEVRAYQSKTRLQKKMMAEFGK